MKATVWLLCACALGAQTVTLTGRVTNAITHEPIESVTVHLWQSNRPTLSEKTDASGRFRMPEVKAGTYRLIPSRAGFEGAAKEIRIESGADPPQSDLTMMRWPGLRGRVLDPERQVVARVRVRAIKEGGAPGLVYEATTDAAGYYAFDRLQPGQYIFLATPPAAEISAGPTELAPTYFPSITDKRDAPQVRLAAGEEFSSYDIVLHEVPVFRLPER